SAGPSAQAAGRRLPRHKQREFPKKVTSKPCLGRELVCIFSTLDGEWREPRRCGRIAGYRGLPPTPGHGCPAIRAQVVNLRARSTSSVFKRSGYRFAVQENASK